MRSFRPYSWLVKGSSVLAFALLWSAGVSAQTVEVTPLPREVIEARLRQYVGKDAQRENTLKSLFAEAGCAGVLEQPVKNSKIPNVICILPGSTDRTIIVGAHFDHVTDGSGVVDNWSGASLLPSLYEVLQHQPRKHTYVFIGFTDEEQGEIGSQFYVRQMSRDEVSRTDAMVNLDTLGLGPTEAWSSRADQKLLRALWYVADQLKLPVSGMNMDDVGSTDSEQFAARKIPTITIHSLTQEAWDARVLHSRKDNLSAVHLADYYQTYQLLSSFIAFADEYLQPPQIAGTEPLPAKTNP